MVSLVATVSSAGPASGLPAPVRSTLFVAGNVSCGVNVKQIGGMTCFSNVLPESQLDGYLELHRHHRAILGERGDSPWRAGQRVRLLDGNFWVRVGVVCSFKNHILRCSNEDNHGFKLTPTGYRRF